MGDCEGRRDGWRGRDLGGRRTACKHLMGRGGRSWAGQRWWRTGRSMATGVTCVRGMWLEGVPPGLGGAQAGGMERWERQGGAHGTG